MLLVLCNTPPRIASPHVTFRPTPARRFSGSKRLDEPTLVQFVLLSMLLHILAIVLFGATGRGGTGSGEALPGTLDVIVRPAAPKIEAAPERLQPIAPPAMERELAAPLEAPARLAPTVPSAPLEKIAPPAFERALANPAELPQLAVPVAPASPLEPLAPAPAEHELEPLAPAPAEHELAAPAEPLRELPLEPPGPIERALAPPIERELSPAIEAPAQVLPSAPAPPLEHLQPPPSVRELAPPPELPATLPPARVPAPEEQVTRPVTPPPAPGAPAPSRAPPAAGTPAPESSPSPIFGAPRPDEGIFKPRRETPHLDLEAAKKRAVREMAREGSGSPGVLPFPLPVPETKTKEAKAMEKAIKPDCRTAYAGMGLLAVPALIAATITEEGCRW
jgi:hypothetical protein